MSIWDTKCTVYNVWYSHKLFQVTASTFWNFNTTIDQKRGIYANFSSHMDLLREITPGSGTYIVGGMFRRHSTQVAKMPDHPDLLSARTKPTCMSLTMNVICFHETSHHVYWITDPWFIASYWGVNYERLVEIKRKLWVSSSFYHNYTQSVHDYTAIRTIYLTVGNAVCTWVRG